MTTVSHLRAFQALELAMRYGSLKKAAEILGITPAAVGQRIKTLEDYLGIELIVRGRSGLRPTGALVPALNHLEKAFLELGRATERLDFQRINEIHIAANSDWVELWLAPRLPDFRKSFPNILFCINGEGDVPMRLGRADIEIRFGECVQQENLDLFFKDYLAPIGSLENTRRIRKLAKKDDLEEFPLLHLDFYKEDPEAITWPDWIEAHGHRRTAFTRGIRYQRIAPGLQAVASNAGFMICGLALISGKVEKGEVVLPFEINKGAWTSHTFHARYRSDAVVRGQIRCFREWLADESRKTEEWLDRFIARD
jgi:LysR family transcriptional regulator, glycine cleavage system transcriptional activator